MTRGETQRHVVKASFSLSIKYFKVSFTALLSSFKDTVPSQLRRSGILRVGFLFSLAEGIGVFLVSPAALSEAADTVVST